MTENIKSDSTLEDIIFANRNKEYGAYDLRKIYNKTFTRSFLIGSAAFIFAMFVPTLYASLNRAEEEAPPVLANVMKIPPPPMDNKVPPPPPPPPPPPETPKVDTKKFLPPEIVEVAEKEEPIVEQKELVNTKIADETVKGDPNAVEAIIDETPVAKEEIVEVVREEEIFTVVEQNAEFPGGQSAMGKFLQKNLRYPPPAQRANVSGKVFLSFVVDRNGDISDVSVLKGLGFGCDEEAMRVVKAMPKWNPGKQSGRSVKSKFNLPISFVLE